MDLVIIYVMLPHKRLLLMENASWGDEFSSNTVRYRIKLRSIATDPLILRRDVARLWNVLILFGMENESELTTRAVLRRPTMTAVIYPKKHFSRKR